MANHAESREPVSSLVLLFRILSFFQPSLDAIIYQRSMRGSRRHFPKQQLFSCQEFFHFFPPPAFRPSKARRFLIVWVNRKGPDERPTGPCSHSRGGCWKTRSPSSRARTASSSAAPPRRAPTPTSPTAPSTSASSEVPRHPGGING